MIICFFLPGFGQDEDDLSSHIEDYKTLKSFKLDKVVRGKKHLPSVICDRILLQHEIHLWVRSMLSVRSLPPQALRDIMDLSISMYHDVRSGAQVRDVTIVI